MLGKRLFIWFGAEANARAITTLIATGTTLGALGYFLFDRIAPQVSLQWSQTNYGEGYRRGRQEAQLEFKLHTVEQSLDALRLRMKIDNKVKNMTDQELKAAGKKWILD